MQLASITTVPVPAPAPAPEEPSSGAAAKAPTYIGLRVSDDREFSAPQYADRVRDLVATNPTDAVTEAQALLTSGAFDGPGARDAARAVAVLRTSTGGFSAGSVTEATFGRFQPVDVKLDDPHFDHWFEAIVTGIATPTETHVIER